MRIPKDRIFLRIVLKLLRKVPIINESLLKIMAGPLKGHRWCLSYNSNGALLGEHDEGVDQAIMALCEPGGCFYDLGASGGYVSLIAAKFLGPTGKVYSFEPLPANLDYLRMHIFVNGATQAEIFDMAISNQVGTLQFSNVSDNPMANTYLKESFAFGKNSVTVKTTDVDSWVERHGARPPTVIKMDIEGAELDGLEGARNTIAKYRPYIALSTHDVHLPGVDQKCLQFLDEMGYVYQRVTERKDRFKGIDDYIAWHKENPPKKK